MPLVLEKKTRAAKMREVSSTPSHAQNRPSNSPNIIKIIDHPGPVAQNPLQAPRLILAALLGITPAATASANYISKPTFPSSPLWPELTLIRPPIITQLTLPTPINPPISLGFPRRSHSGEPLCVESLVGGGMPVAIPLDVVGDAQTDVA